MSIPEAPRRLADLLRVIMNRGTAEEKWVLLIHTQVCSGKYDVSWDAEPEDLATGLVIGKRCFPALINVVTGPSLWFAWRLRRHAGTSWQAIRQTLELEWVQSNRTVFLSRRSVSVGRREFSRTVRCFYVLWLWPVIFGDLLGRHLLQPQCWIYLQLHRQPLKYKKHTKSLKYLNSISWSHIRDSLFSSRGSCAVRRLTLTSDIKLGLLRFSGPKMMISLQSTIYFY